MISPPTHAFVLAAGLGTRLRPYTDNLPKPLVPVQCRPLLDYIFDHLKDAGIKNITVNLHHKADALREFLALRSDLTITQSYETELLETGGGIKKALSTLGTEPFFIVNGDAFWIDVPTHKTLAAMTTAFDPAKMDILLLLQPVEHMKLTKGVGDYIRKPDGQVVRSAEKTGPYMFAGIMLCHPRIFANSPDGKFSMLVLMDKAQEQNRLYSIENPGDWHHISTPEDLEAVNLAMTEK
jgi:MurNAc alpha-1-phosphate uridylyltransferase